MRLPVPSRALAGDPDRLRSLELAAMAHVVSEALAPLEGRLEALEAAEAERATLAEVNAARRARARSLEARILSLLSTSAAVAAVIVARAAG